MTMRTEESPMQEVRRLGWIQRHYAKLSPAGKSYIRKRVLNDKEG